MKIDWKLVAIILLAAVAIFFTGHYGCSKSKELETYQRQIKGQLNEKERELQRANRELGLAQSQLLTQEELNRKMKEDSDIMSKEFKDFVKKHKLKIRSRDNTIASLKQQLKGGETTVEVKDDIIAYSWTDKYNRFKLVDPDIFVSGNETFTAHQIYRLRGSVFAQEAGFLETRRLVLEEVVKGLEGKYEPLGTAEIVDSQFDYTVESPESKWYDIFKLRLRMSVDTGYNLGVGVEFLQFRKVGVGINTRVPVLEPAKSSVGLDLYWDIL
jgi:hypothetical protein